MDNLEQLVNGGPNVPWSKSLRGRLHAAEQIDRATDNLRAAARELRRGRTRTWSARRRRVIFALGVVSIATPYVLHFLPHS